MRSPSGQYPFDRPVIILAAPRSGSTMLFETLMQSADFWTIGGESHGVFESIREFNPLSGTCDSNALAAEDVTPAIRSQIHTSFLSELRNSRGERYFSQPEASRVKPRLLEKTPKNAVRVPMLNEVFPDAMFIYLYRNPRENISSMIDAWQSGRFVTYRNLPGRRGPWSLLLPPGWQKHHESTVGQLAAFQWQAANMAILRELHKLDRKRWTAVSYGQQVDSTRETVQRVCEFCGVSPDDILASLSGKGLTLSRYTLSTPATDKWHKNALALAELVPGLADTVQYIRELVPELPAAEFDLSIVPGLTRDIEAQDADTGYGDSSPGSVGRNAHCPCGSGRRFKHCHGDLRQPGMAP